MNKKTTNRRSSGKGPNKRRTFSNSKPQRSGARKNTSGGRHGQSGRGRNPRQGGGRGKRKIPTFNPSQFINTNPVKIVEEPYVAKNTFETFGLDKELSDIVLGLGFKEPSPIQDQVIEHILADRDVIGLAETGTGKTAAFLLPMIQKTIHKPGRQTLIMAPTRELAIQIEDELRKLSRGFRISSVVCVGGVNINPQIKAFRRFNQFVIGTPGRLIDLMDRGVFKPNTVTTVVLDEADRMLDMGFIHDMRKILGMVPAKRETLFFSATMNKDAEKIVHDFLRDPVTVSVKKKDVTDSIEQNIVPFTATHKYDKLVEMLRTEDFRRVLVFGSMKHSVERLSRQLVHDGIRSESIHGNKSHPQRQRALKKFKSGNAQVLVATDVAARGIHVDNVSHVINYDLPTCFEDYVHRIGRTGRGTKRGKALTFVPAS